MLIELPGVLNSEQLAFVQAQLAQGEFVDGRYSAGVQARRNKFNQELASPVDALNNIVMGSLVRHPQYLHAGLPCRVAAPFYCRYQQEMHYGLHTDDPVMGKADSRYRSDIAITLFLNSPEDYDGGELVIHTTFGVQHVKLTAGDGVMYPASSRHEVSAVTRGERLVAVTWMQSLVREPERRELLYQLYLARETLLAMQPNEPATHQVDQCYINLVRMWSQP